MIWSVVTVAILFVSGLIFSGMFAMRFVRYAQEVFRGNGHAGVDAATKPITTSATTTTTEADGRKRGREFRIRQWVDGYKENGNHNTPCDALAGKMINAWIESNFGTPDTNGSPVSEMCDSLARSPGCSDPLVLTVTGLNATEGHEKVRRLELAIAGFERSGHKAYPKLNALMGLMAEVSADFNRYAPLYRSAEQSVEECFRDGSFRPEDQAEIAEIFVNGWGRDLIQRSTQGIHRFSRRAEAPFEWLSLVLEGEFQIKQAWKARGGGYANTVSPDGWQAFQLYLATAGTNLTKAWKLRPDLPLAPCRMMYVALGLSDAREMRLWFDRTLAAQIDYRKAWSEMRWGLRPRWHGSLDAMLALGTLALDTKRFDTDVPRTFFDVVSDLESELRMPYGQHIYGRADIWPSMQRMYEGYIAQPDDGNRAGWRSSYSAVAYLAGRYDVAKEQLEALDWRPWLGNLAGWGADLSLMSLEVGARTGSLGTRITEAEAAYRSANVAAALRGYQELKNSTDADERTRKFIAHRVATLELEKRLQTGEWMELLPKDENDPAWVIASGKAHRLADGTLEVASDKFGHMLFCRARLGTNFEITGEFDIVKSSDGAFQAGLVMGQPNPDDTAWYSFVIKDNPVEREVISFGQGWSPPRITKPVALNGDRNSFYFRFQDGKANALLGSNEVLHAVEPTRSMQIHLREFLVGLGACNDMNETVIRYRGVRVRMLK